MQNWELRAALEAGPNTFALKFKRQEIIDRKPMPGVVSVSLDPISANFAVSSPTLRVGRQYPQPPSEQQMDIDHPDVQTMLNRYMGYRQGREPLPSMAYFCYEVFVRRCGRGPNDAATKHKMSHNLIKRVSNLASNKGGDQARHEHGICQPLAQPEVQVLEKAVAAMITRAAMVVADPSQPMHFIDCSNLLEMSPQRDHKDRETASLAGAPSHACAWRCSHRTRNLWLHPGLPGQKEVFDPPTAT